MVTKVLLAAVMLLGLPAWNAGACRAVDSEFASRLSSEGKAALASSLMLTIPAETEASVQIISAIQTEVSHVDDPVVAQLLRPLMVNGRVALPAGTLVDGRITRIRPAGRLRRPAMVALRFEQVILPDGDIEPISAALSWLDSPRVNARVDSEGFLKGGGDAKYRKGLGGGLVVLGVLGTAKLAAGAAPLWTILPAGGAAWLGYEFLWRRGSEVHVPPQTSGRIRLDYPLTVRVAW